MGNQFIKINPNSGERPAVRPGGSGSGSIEAERALYQNIFSSAASQYDELSAGVNSLDIASLKETIAEDVADAEAKANKTSSSEKTSNWLSAISGLTTAAGTVFSMNGLSNATKTAAAQTSQAAAGKTDYTKLSDDKLAEQLQTYTRNKETAQTTIDEQTTVSRAQQKIIDSINDGTHEECKILENLNEEVKALNLETGTDQLVTEYKSINNDLTEINKGADGSLQECIDLKTAQDTKIYKTETKTVNGQTVTEQVEDTDEEQKAIKAAQDKLQAKQKELTKDLENKKIEIDNEKSKRERAVRTQETKIEGLKKDAITKNGEACSKIATATTDLNNADAQIKAIQTEQSSRAAKSK